MAQLSDVEIAKTADDFKNYISQCNEYMQHNKDLLPRGLFEAYGIEIRLALSRLAKAEASAAAFSPAKAFTNSEHKNIYTYSAIICMHKRPGIDDIYQAIIRQSIPPKSILMLINEQHINPSEIRERYPGALVVQSGINSLYTRWAIGYTLDGDYIFVCDDDQMPGANYIEKAIDLSSRKRALVCGTGRRYSRTGKQGFYESISPYELNEKGASALLKAMAIECDWGCNSYLFRKDWIHYILAEERYSNLQLKIDDIQLAYNLHAYGGIGCWVAQQDTDNISTLHSIDTGRGNDEHALWSKSDHFTIRKDYLDYLINNKLYTPYYDRIKDNG
jgi:hypothetical protein